MSKTEQELMELTENALAQTEQPFAEHSRQLIEIDQHYLDGEFDRQLIKRRILQSKVAIAQHIYYMGRDLLALKEHSEHGEFRQDLEELGIAKSTAQRYMAVALKFNTPKMQQLIKGLNSDKGVLTKLLELSAEPDEELEQLVEGGSVAGLELDDIDRMSAKELREALKKVRDEHDADRAAHDQVIQQKNQHTDELAKELAKLQGKSQAERWPEIVKQFNEDLAIYGTQTSALLDSVYKIVLSPGELELPDGARKQMAAAAVAKVNELSALVGELQSAVFDEFSYFLNLPTYSLADPLTMIDGEGENEEPQS